jgi:SAM-dependent methyltransferase
MQNCRLCKADADFQSIRAPFVFGGKDEHNFWSCSICGAIYLYPIPSPEEEKKFYFQEFEKFMSSRVGDHRDWSNAEKHKTTNEDQVHRRLPFFKDYLKKDLDLLEIGCSSGFMLDAFKAKGLNCIGVEPSGEFKDFLIQSGHNVVQDISEIEEHKKFDIIAHFFVLEHIRDPFAFLSQSYDLLKENGVIICEIPCANDPLTSIYNIDAFEKFYWSIAHHYYYTPTSIKYVLNSLKYKFKIVPEQRYDISNHMTWMMEGKPGGQNKFFKEFGLELNQTYRQRLKDTWQCDTIFLYIWKK